MIRVTPELVLQAYSIGVFPMAESAEDEHLYWFDPLRRGIIDFDDFYVPKRLRRSVRKQPFRVTVDQAFDHVLQTCAEVTAERSETWINAAIRDLYNALHRRGYGHSVELWDAQGGFAGGLYGVALGAAFFGESMVTRQREASKIALVHLAARLQAGGFQLLDTQFVTRHLAQFGAKEIDRDSYQQRLGEAIGTPADFFAVDDQPGGEADAVEALLQAQAGRQAPPAPARTAEDSLADYFDPQV